MKTNAPHHARWKARTADATKSDWRTFIASGRATGWVRPVAARQTQMNIAQVDHAYEFTCPGRTNGITTEASEAARTNAMGIIQVAEGAEQVTIIY